MEPAIAPVIKSVSGAAPTRVRYKVVAFAAALAGVTYLDRICISVLAPSMMRDLSLSKVEMGFVFSAFTLAYGLFEIPTAWWADRIGTRRVLTRIVLWWSAFTMLTAAAYNHVSLLVIRFLFGVGEAGAWPCAARTFSRWIPAKDRGKVQGVFFASAHLAGGLTPILVTALMVYFSWRAIFVIVGTVGVFWAIGWYRWFRDEPTGHPAVNEAELGLITANRGDYNAGHGDKELWARLLTSPSMIGLCVTHFANGYGAYFLMTWLPTYLEQQRGFHASQLALFAGLPMLLSVVADLTGGVVTDSLARRFGLRFGRATVGGGGYLIAGVAVLAAAATGHAVLAAVLIAVAAASSMFTTPSTWSTVIEIGGPNVAVVGAAMNTVGQAGGFLSPIVLAYSVQEFSNWAVPFYVMGGLYFISAACWCFINPCKSIVPTKTSGGSL
jgi:MFS transporter, ACS family, glucarate transporter